MRTMRLPGDFARMGTVFARYRSSYGQPAMGGQSGSMR
jgi:hypothetical protein